MRLRLLYFASLADHAGCSGETVHSKARNPAALYEEIRMRHAFTLGQDRLRVAVNGRIVDWDMTLQEDDEVVFLPPVSGG